MSIQTGGGDHKPIFVSHEAISGYAKKQKMEITVVGQSFEGFKPCKAKGKGGWKGKVVSYVKLTDSKGNELIAVLKEAWEIDPGIGKQMSANRFAKMMLTNAKIQKSALETGVQMPEKINYSVSSGSLAAKYFYKPRGEKGEMRVRYHELGSPGIKLLNSKRITLKIKLLKSIKDISQQKKLKKELEKVCPGLKAESILKTNWISKKVLGVFGKRVPRSYDMQAIDILTRQNIKGNTLSRLIKNAEKKKQTIRQGEIPVNKKKVISFSDPKKALKQFDKKLKELSIPLGVLKGKKLTKKQGGKLKALKKEIKPLDKSIETLRRDIGAKYNFKASDLKFHSKQIGGIDGLITNANKLLSEVYKETEPKGQNSALLEMESKIKNLKKIMLKNEEKVKCKKQVATKANKEQFKKLDKKALLLIKYLNDNYQKSNESTGAIYKKTQEVEQLTIRAQHLLAKLEKQNDDDVDDEF